jgi:hypothetical protein
MTGLRMDCVLEHRIPVLPGACTALPRWCGHSDTCVASDKQIVTLAFPEPQRMPDKATNTQACLHLGVWSFSICVQDGVPMQEASGQRAARQVLEAHLWRHRSTTIAPLWGQAATWAEGYLLALLSLICTKTSTRISSGSNCRCGTGHAPRAFPKGGIPCHPRPWGATLCSPPLALTCQSMGTRRVRRSR